MSESYDHPAARDAERLWKECEVERLRRSGPGGQHRNKVETAIRLRHLPTGVMAEASERRSQAQNRAEALFRLRVSLAIEVRMPCDSEHAPSALWRSRAGGGRIRVSESHEDFPSLLAEALDVLAAHGGDPKPASAALGCSSSQLIRLLKIEPRALAEVNRRRHELGLHPLQ